MTEDDNIPADKAERRLQAVLALLHGQSATHVQQWSHICRSDLYKFKRRALVAMRAAVAGQKRGPQRPANRVSGETEQQLRTVCERYPTRSSYQVQRHLWKSDSKMWIFSASGMVSGHYQGRGPEGNDAE